MKISQSCVIGFAVSLILATVSQSSFATADLPFTGTSISLFPTTPDPFNAVIARGDLDTDGVDDLILGSTGGTTKTAIRLQRTDAGGQTTDITSRLVGAPSAIEFFQPQALIADFNHDGLNDVIFFDAGNPTRARDGGYMGGVPMAFYSAVGTTDLTYSPAVGAAIATYRSFYNMPITTCGPTPMFFSRLDCDVWAIGDNQLGSQSNESIHSKFQSFADIDGDTDIDIFVEGGGGFGGQAYALVFVNNGFGQFVVKTDRVSDLVLKGPNAAHSWRHYRNHLADMNGDGYPDLILGKLANVQSIHNPDHDILFSKVLLNDGTGRFPDTMVTELPNPLDFEVGPLAQATAVTAILANDFDGDGLTDLLLAHTRGSDATNFNVHWAATGRYLQFFRQDSLGHYRDMTRDYFADQTPYTRIDLQDDFSHDPDNAQYFSRNYNAPWNMRFVDVDADGFMDIAMEQVHGNIHADYSPTLYRWNGAQFEGHSSSILQAPQYYYYSGNGLAFLQTDSTPTFEMLWAGAISGTGPGQPLNGLYSFRQ